MAKRKKRNKKVSFVTGIIALILALIGAFSVVRFSVNSIKDLTNQTEKKREYESLLTPVVMFDPDPFDDLTQADVSQLLNSAVWALLMSENGADKYPYSEGEKVGIIVPQTDIENYFVSLFGTEIDIASLHSSIDMSEYDITYDAALKSYILPITGVESAYTPKVYEIEKKGSSVILSVGYIGNKAWVQIADGEYATPEPDKYMKITLRERGDGMYISSIQAVDGQEVVGSTSAQTTRPPETEILSTTAVTVPATEAVEVTDENGETVTDENGEAVTEYVTVSSEVSTQESTSEQEDETE